MTEILEEILEALSHAPADARAEEVRPEAAAAWRVTPHHAVSSSALFSRVSMGEEMVALRQRIDVLFPDHPNRAIEFIGSREGEGTSTVVDEFARVSATRFGQRVLLLELDPRGREERRHGLGSNGTVAGAGRLDIAPLPQEFLAASTAGGSPGPAATWRRLRAAYDLILVDAPPATTSPQGLAVSRQVDGVVLVLAAEDTRRPVAERVKQSIERSGGRVLGIVFNKRQYHIPPCIYRRL
jgi:Mrp family chromosome partitioning ATPase